MQKQLPQVSTLIKAIVNNLKRGGRIFYVGGGIGGGLSILDALSLPATFGIPEGIVNVILAGGGNLVHSLSESLDDQHEAWTKLVERNVSWNDIVIGVSASGTTPYVLEALKQCRKFNIPTGCIVNNPDTPIATQSDFPVEVITGPEFVTGSTRMKCGTAQKMLLDMISTTVMIRLGRVEGNSMINVRLSDEKTMDRSISMLMRKASISSYEEARKLLLETGSVKNALFQLQISNS